jgi:hypothetical protein
MPSTRWRDPRRWIVTDHVCRLCLGRVLELDSGTGETGVRCAECGEEGPAWRALCCCGQKLNTGADAKLRCVLNAARSLELPEQVLVEYAESAPVATAPPRPKPKPPRADSLSLDLDDDGS